jgi:hypothetical protein
MPVNLTISNIDSKRMMITIERAKVRMTAGSFAANAIKRTTGIL